MDSYGFIRIPMDSYGIPMNSYGFLWIDTDSYGFLWNSYGFLWTGVAEGHQSTTSASMAYGFLLAWRGIMHYGFLWIRILLTTRTLLAIILLNRVNNV
jgi:hypothetical protein